FKLIPIKGIKVGTENLLSNGVKKHLKKNVYDLVIMNGYSKFPEMGAIKYLKKHKIPYCLYINGGIIHSDESSFKKKLKTKYIAGADFYMSPDENSDNYLVYYGADKAKIKRYVYSTTYESEVLKAPLSKEEVKELRKKLDIDAEHVFISCGQLIKRKNYVDLVKAWPKDKDIMLIIAGDGKQKDEIQKIIDEQKKDNVRLIGFLQRNNVFTYYRASDAFLFPSHEDIYGHVINEALAQGLPICSLPNVNASKKLIKDGYNGYIVNSIGEMITSLDKLEKCDKKNAIKTAKENTIEIMVEDHKKILS
ncbi:glycosyltransferase family 4 protein, partial [Pseudobutyrivibrio sp.]